MTCGVCGIPVPSDADLHPETGAALCEPCYAEDSRARCSCCGEPPSMVPGGLCANCAYEEVLDYAADYGDDR